MSNNPFRRYLSPQPPESLPSPAPSIEISEEIAGDDGADDELLRLEEEELRMKLKLIELQKKRLAARSPGPRSPPDVASKSSRVIVHDADSIPQPEATEAEHSASSSHDDGLPDHSPRSPAWSHSGSGNRPSFPGTRWDDPSEQVTINHASVQSMENLGPLLSQSVSAIKRPSLGSLNPFFRPVEQVPELERSHTESPRHPLLQTPAIQTPSLNPFFANNYSASEGSAAASARGSGFLSYQTEAPKPAQSQSEHHSDTFPADPDAESQARGGLQAVNDVEEDITRPGNSKVSVDTRAQIQTHGVDESVGNAHTALEGHYNQPSPRSREPQLQPHSIDDHRLLYGNISERRDLPQSSHPSEFMATTKDPMDEQPARRPLSPVSAVTASPYINHNDTNAPPLPSPKFQATVESTSDSHSERSFSITSATTRLSSGTYTEQSQEAPEARPPSNTSGNTQQEADEPQSPQIGAGFEEDETCNCGRAQPSKDECYFCWPCNGTIFCKICWDQCPPHKRGKFGRLRQVGLPHEKSEPLVARKIFETLQSEHDLEQQALAHSQDEDTSWFGTGKDIDTGEIVFQDFGRYSRLMAQHSSERRRTRFPALVSFVGQTGAGKSSLIRLLIETLAPGGSMPQVPVVGSSLHADLPTSGDVHLYPDLKTFEEDQPMLFADCEGLDGGERQPMGARKGKKVEETSHRTQSFTRHIRKQHHTPEREISWADTPLKKSREYHVRHLYPRLLFTFSDCIVFVMRNPRVIEDTIVQLINWAAAALETSSNQPVLPHAIIVLNAFDNSSDPELWDVNNSTIDLMQKVDRAVHQNHTLRKYAEFWREKGRQVETVETLLLSYYSSIRVVRVPERGRPSLINEQVLRLYQEIQDACTKFRISKHEKRMLLNSDELQPYLQHAFDHFCRNLDRPFDFVQASLAFHPIPSNFGGNILKLAIDIMKVWKNRVDGPSIFKELSFLVASSIMLDSARRHTLGTAEKVFGAYVHHCDEVLSTFCNLHWPCEYVHPETFGRCVNVQAGHQKGHQLSNGKLIQVGTYQSGFTADKYREFFAYCIVHNLMDLLDRLRAATEESLHLSNVEELKASEIHRDKVLSPFFRHLSGSKHFINHTACFCCLICPPEHPLPCGHVLCTPCVQAYGKTQGTSMVEMIQCPLHHLEEDGQFRVRWPVSIKPTGAGVRVLTLDGGGVRGIVELIILQAIETQLGLGLPIQAFFDLIVGTSTGGIIALGLGANGWSVEKCIQQFKRLCKKAFKKRWGMGLPGVEHLISLANSSSYETGPIEATLQQAFGVEQTLFAGSRDGVDNETILRRITKVAVTTVTTAGTVALLGSYNRMDEGDDAPYEFHRAENPEAEIKTWEAARATSAAPTIFKPFAHVPSGQVYQDGAIHHNNPVGPAIREQRLIWPDTANRCPDILLSVGTGVNANNRKPLPSAATQPKFGILSGSRHLYKMAVDHVTTSLNSEKMWKDFVLHSNTPEPLKNRYVRLNLKMQKDPPRMDEIRQLDDLEEMARNQMTRDRPKVKEVADRLLATSFYFALDYEGHQSSRYETDAGPHIVTGKINCRFPPYSSEIRSLGEALRKRLRSAYNVRFAEHNPCFVIHESREGINRSKQIVVTTNIVDQMINEGLFTLEKITVQLSSRRAETEMFFSFGDQPQGVAMYPISGFPRCFMDELATKSNVTRTASSNTKRPRWDADRPDLEKKLSDWTLTAAENLKLQSPFQMYGSADYVNPGNAAPDFLESLKRKYHGGPSLESVGKYGSNRSPSMQSVATYGSNIAEMGDSEGPVIWKVPSNTPVPEDETIRRQLMRLLFSRNKTVSGPPIVIQAPNREMSANARAMLEPYDAPPRVPDRTVYELP